MPEVAAKCDELRRHHRIACVLWAEEEPESTACGSDPGPLDPCLWSVYVGEIHEGSHASRWATFYVDTARGSVVGVGALECGPMTLAAWRAREARKKKRADPPCPEDVQ